MDKKIQRIAISVTDPAAPFSSALKNEFTEDFINGAKKIVGINVKSGISGDSLLDIEANGKKISDNVPVSAFMCDEDNVSPDTRFLTAIPDVGDISTKSIEIIVHDDGTSSSYPYTATVLLLLEVQ